MIDILNSFIQTYNRKGHIHYLMDKRKIMICLNTENGEFTFILNNNEATAFEEYGQVDQLEIVNISGNHEKIADLLTGNTKLRESISNQYLTSSSSLRTTLVLESIFFLTNKENPSFLVG